MRKHTFVLLLIISMVVLSACNNVEEQSSDDQLKVGIMLSDNGLGDQSFSDMGFAGLEKARDELGISFDYRELQDSETYEQGLEELVEQGNDLIIGLGFSIQEALETAAQKYPEVSFLLIDSKSDLPNVYNITFKEEEGSFLVGVIAGMKTQSNVVGFVGGEDVELIHKFENGFVDGVKAVNPDAKILTEYAGTFGDDQLGKKIAGEMIVSGVDYIYPAAGFTGVGVLLQSQESGIYSFGVDSDQFYLAEEAIVSSMVKQVDVAIFNTVKELAEKGSISEKDQQLGLKENGVAIAPIRIISLSAQEQKTLDQYIEEISNGTATVRK
ncbi:BMP family ABC transporter substrate-binding protein [Lysinibacillus yapensis]|uniref:BMP family ABC transporter substrate-binding protein n=1 Tax=Ureibacillus yapensis TaxID=2304605 RepID=A0A396S3H7_9BACL|nr:BMP family ABC transporter substrate-binding protein [Lysinibacillus yapensis]RHW32770.1 BMP family ABC transporter substrate-binding protein [Lysinibacillus yapensis]